MPNYDRREDLIGELKRTLPLGKWPRDFDLPDIYFDTVLWLIRERERLLTEVERLRRNPPQSVGTLGDRDERVLSAWTEGSM